MGDCDSGIAKVNHRFAGVEVFVVADEKLPTFSGSVVLVDGLQSRFSTYLFHTVLKKSST